VMAPGLGIKSKSLAAAISRVRITQKKQRLHGELILTCAWCKRVRNELGSWLPMEQYIASHSDTKFTHGLCKDCLRTLDPNLKRVNLLREGRLPFVATCLFADGMRSLPCSQRKAPKS
jgi:hypothetical protein